MLAHSFFVLNYKPHIGLLVLLFVWEEAFSIYRLIRYIKVFSTIIYEILETKEVCDYRSKVSQCIVTWIISPSYNIQRYFCLTVVRECIILRKSTNVCTYNRTFLCILCWLKCTVLPHVKPILNLLSKREKILECIWNKIIKTSG